MKQLKRANGTGSVYKLSGRRTRPYVAMVTTYYSTNYDGSKTKRLQKRTPLGYFRTRDEAMLALLEYNRNPYELSENDITFAELYDAWSAEHYKGLSASAIRTYKSAYSYFSPIHELKFKNIRPRDIERCINKAEVHSATKKRMKSLCGLLYDFAIKNEIIGVNYARLCNNVKADPPKYNRIPFKDDEIKLLWKHRNDPYVGFILVALYTGMRPGELVELKKHNVNLREKYFVGGFKTEAGTDRIIPIHDKIYAIISDYYQKSVENIDGNLFISDNGNPISYFQYRRYFMNIMDRFGMSHLPHDTRHTFISLAKEAGMDEYILKLIVGHAIEDITERVYTHRNIEALRREIAKIK